MTSIEAWLETMWGIGPQTVATTMSTWSAEPYRYPAEITEWLHQMWGFPRPIGAVRRFAA